MGIDFQKNYYTTLGLEKSASLEDIKKAYRELAKLYHPDVNPSGSQKFEQIKEAYEFLSDPRKKWQYDGIRKNWEYGPYQFQKDIRRSNSTITETEEVESSEKNKIYVKKYILIFITAIIFSYLIILLG